MVLPLFATRFAAYRNNDNNDHDHDNKDTNNGNNNNDNLDKNVLNLIFSC